MTDIKHHRVTKTCNYVTIGNLTIYFSFESVIGFELFFKDGEDLKHRECWIENVWGSSLTGRHMNMLGAPHKKSGKRLPEEEFKTEMRKILWNQGIYPLLAIGQELNMNHH